VAYGYEEVDEGEQQAVKGGLQRQQEKRIGGEFFPRQVPVQSGVEHRISEGNQYIGG
jgi:hypothetical protein